MEREEQERARREAHRKEMRERLMTHVSEREAAQVFQVHRERLSEQRFWLLANLSRAYALLGKELEAMQWHQRAVAQAMELPQSRASYCLAETVAALRLLHQSGLCPVAARLLPLFKPFRVLVFASHHTEIGQTLSASAITMPPLDAVFAGPIVNSPRRQAVVEHIERELDRLQPSVGYVLTLTDSDILFAEALIRRKIEVHVVLLFDQEDFQTYSVECGLHGSTTPDVWLRRVNAVFRAARMHFVTTEKYRRTDASTGMLYEMGRKIAQGLAILRTYDNRGAMPFLLMALCANPNEDSVIARASAAAGNSGGVVKSVASAGSNPAAPGAGVGSGPSSAALGLGGLGSPNPSGGSALVPAGSSLASARSGAGGALDVDQDDGSGDDDDDVADQQQRGDRKLTLMSFEDGAAEERRQRRSARRQAPQAAQQQQQQLLLGPGQAPSGGKTPGVLGSATPLLPALNLAAMGGFGGAGGAGATGTGAGTGFSVTHSSNFKPDLAYYRVPLDPGVLAGSAGWPICPSWEKFAVDVVPVLPEDVADLMGMSVAEAAMVGKDDALGKRKRKRVKEEVGQDPAIVAARNNTIRTGARVIFLDVIRRKVDGDKSLGLGFGARGGAATGRFQVDPRSLQPTSLLGGGAGGATTGGTSSMFGFSQSPLGSDGSSSSYSAAAAAGQVFSPVALRMPGESDSVIPLIKTPGRMDRVGYSPPVFSPATLHRMFPSSFKRILRFMLFSDVKNYSKLKEEVLPLFNSYFLSLVQSTREEMEDQVEHASTWGDGLFCVFSSVIDCAVFALNLLTRVNATDWTVVGLPASTTVRIGLHAGPVFSGFDPLIQEFAYYGRHVERAAMIEPITTPGCVFGTEQFAACLALHQARLPQAERRVEVDFVTTTRLEQERERTVARAALEKKVGGGDGGGHGHGGGSDSSVIDEYLQCPLFNISWKEDKDPSLKLSAEFLATISGQSGAPARKSTSAGQSASAPNAAQQAAAAAAAAAGPGSPQLAPTGSPTLPTATVSTPAAGTSTLTSPKLSPKMLPAVSLAMRSIGTPAVAPLQDPGPMYPVSGGAAAATAAGGAATPVVAPAIPAVTVSKAQRVGGVLAAGTMNAPLHLSALPPVQSVSAQISGKRGVILRR